MHSTEKLRMFGNNTCTIRLFIADKECHSTIKTHFLPPTFGSVPHTTPSVHKYKMFKTTCDIHTHFSVSVHLFQSIYGSYSKIHNILHFWIEGVPFRIRNLLAIPLRIHSTVASSNLTHQTSAQKKKVMSR